MPPIEYRYDPHPLPRRTAIDGLRIEGADYQRMRSSGVTESQMIQLLRVKADLAALRRHEWINARERAWLCFERWRRQIAALGSCQERS